MSTSYPVSRVLLIPNSEVTLVLFHSAIKPEGDSDEREDDGSEYRRED